MEDALLKFLVERKYAIVLDDIWKKEVQDDPKVAFLDKKNGNRIIFITCVKEVALHPNLRSPLHEPHLLSDDDG